MCTIGFCLFQRQMLVVLLCLSVISRGFCELLEFTSASDFTERALEQVVLQGHVAVVRGAAMDWELSNWSCTDYRTNPNMSEYKIERVYGESDGSYVPLCPECAEWEGDARQSGNKDQGGPAYAPLYWDVKGDPQAREYIATLTKPFPFLSPRNQHAMRRSPELWFAPPLSGAKSHMDSHIQATMAVQLTGHRRWRLGRAPARERPTMERNYMDKDTFDWSVDHSILLNTSDVLIFPPGTIHETLNPSSEHCAASFTAQLAWPLPLIYYRKNLRYFLFNSDLEETWPVILDLVTWGHLQPRLSASAPYFTRVDNKTSIEEFLANSFDAEKRGPFGKRPLVDYMVYHDINLDGTVTQSEFLENAMEWYEMETDIFESLPPMVRPLRYFPALRDNPKFYKALAEYEQAIHDEL